MAKAKLLIRAKPEKSQATSQSLKKIEKKTTADKPKSVKSTKQKLVKDTIKGSTKSRKDADIVKKEDEANVPTVTRRLVLAPTESPTPKKLVKSQKTKLKSIENDTATLDDEVETAAVGLSDNKLKPKKKPLGKKLKHKKVKASKVASKKPIPKLYEAVPIKEDTFNEIVKVSKVTEIVKALKKLVESEVAKQKTSIFGDYTYCLNVASFKIASCPKRMVKLNLQHALVDTSKDDVLIVVPDLKRGAKVEFESTIEHYTDMFQEAGIQGIKIMPFNQLRNEYKSFESKRKLASTYDYFMCDARIVGQIVGFCGTTFQKPRTTFHTVRMEKPKSLKNEIDKALRRTAYKQLSKGDLITIPIASERFTAEQIAENVMEVVSQLKTIYPGGLENIRAIDIKVNLKGTSSLPIYVSTSSGPDEAPYVVGPREQLMLKLKKQANDVLAKFALTKNAEIQKLSPAQVERKRKFKETRTALLKDYNEIRETDKKEVSDEIDIAVSAKKSRKATKEPETKVKTKTTAKKEKQT